jgi:hypothetical protein
MHGVTTASERRDGMSQKLITTISMVLALATGGVAIPVTGADTGPPQQGGGCNMVFGPLLHSPTSSGLENMMAGSAGSANGIGAANMADMLSRFSTSQFCLGG